MKTGEGQFKKVDREIHKSTAGVALKMDIQMEKRKRILGMPD